MKKNKLFSHPECFTLDITPAQMICTSSQEEEDTVSQEDFDSLTDFNW